MKQLSDHRVFQTCVNTYSMYFVLIQSLCRTSKVEDIKGQPMEALPLTVMSLKYIKEHLLNHINTQKVGIDINDIRFVITVPAIWDDNSKQFMREAAILVRQFLEETQTRFNITCPFLTNSF